MKRLFILFVTALVYVMPVCANDYAKELKAMYERIETRSDIDPDSFAVDIRNIEAELKSMETDEAYRSLTREQNATFRALLHAMLAKAYREIFHANIHAFDAEGKAEYKRLGEEHRSHIFDDMQTLASQHSDDYVPLVERGKDAAVYGNNMLAALMQPMENDYTMGWKEKSELKQRAMEVYLQRGDRSSWAMLKLDRDKRIFIGELNDTEDANVKDQLLARRCEELKALLDSVADTKAADAVRCEWQRNVNSLMRVEAEMVEDECILPNRPFNYKICVRNAKDVVLRVLRYNGKKKNGELRTDGKELLCRNYRPAWVAMRDTISDSIALNFGRYVMVMSADGEKTVEELDITSLHIVAFGLPDNKTKVVVLDRTCGKPVPGAYVLVSKNYDDTPDTLRTGKKGEVVISAAKGGRRLWATTTPKFIGKYNENSTETIFLYKSYYGSNENQSIRGNIFTDRSIYRPGQTVRTSALVYVMNGDETHVVKEGKYAVVLKNPENETVATDTVCIDSMGTIVCDLALPAECKTGEWRVEVNDENENENGNGNENGNYKRDKGESLQLSRTIIVEEYKRPTYTATFAPDTTKYAFADTINVELKAETFSGMPVQGAKAEYIVEVCKRSIWGWMFGNEWLTIDNDEVETDEHGTLRLPIVLGSYSEAKEMADNAGRNQQMMVRITVKCTDEAGESHSAVTTYVIPLKPTPQGEKLQKPYPLQVSQNEIGIGESVNVDFNLEDKGAYVFYYAIAGGKVIDQYEGVTYEALHRKLNCTKEWGTGVSIHIYYIKDGLAHSYQKIVTLRKPEKRLTLKWKTFRNHLQPGQQEQWTLSVFDKEGNAVSGANLMTAMYDASLDEFEQNQWMFGIPFYRHVNQMPIHRTWEGGNVIRMFVSRTSPTNLRMPSDFDRVIDFRLPMGNLARPMMLKEMRVGAQKAAASNDAAEFVGYAMAGPVSAEVMSISDHKQQIANEDKSTMSGGNAAPVSLRQNFNETAFFMPRITTDINGDAQICFTLPESLTQWHFLAFAHTDDVRYAVMDTTVVATRDFMVQPQLPRFLRQGDEATIALRIMNRTDHPITGNATLRVKDAETERILHEKTVPASIVGKGTEVVTFCIPSDIVKHDLIIETMATANNADGICSDGESNLLPVLSTKEAMVDNIPFYILGKGDKTVSLGNLYNDNSPTATERTLQIRVTDNPELDVFRSLSTVSLPEHDNAPSLAAALYSNIVMQDIYKRVTPSGLADSLLSGFCVNESKSQAKKAMDRLRELQLDNGMFAWFKGMQGSPYMTLAVAEHLKKLDDYTKKYGVKCENDFRPMLTSALNALERYERNDFAERKRHKWSLAPSEFDLRYLLIRQQTVADCEMVSTWLDMAKKGMKEMTIYGRAKTALLMHRFGKQKTADLFIKNVKHYLVSKPGMGSYFATDNAYYSWMDYRIPTQVAAMQCIGDTETLAEMQLWLLRQKEVQVWSNPLNAIDVADLLLSLSPNQALRTEPSLTLSLDGKSVDLKEEKWTAINVDNMPREAIAEKSSDGISWGYIRGTYNEEFAQLKGNENGAAIKGELTIARKQYVLRQGELQEAKDEDLHIGDEVVTRLIVHAERDMDFVRVSTKHPANFEQKSVRSGYQNIGERWGYVEIHDAETSVFFDSFTRGTTTIDLHYYVTRTGKYQRGISSVTCEYADQYNGYCK